MLPPEFRLPFYISYASITLQLSRMLQISFPLCQLFTQNIISLFVLTFMLLPFQSLPQVLNFDIAECLSMKLKKKKKTCFCGFRGNRGIAFYTCNVCILKDLRVSKRSAILGFRLVQQILFGFVTTAVFLGHIRKNCHGDCHFHVCSSSSLLPR